MKRALILGVGGQDGSYLADILLERGHEVHGMYRHSSVDNLVRIAHIRDQITLHRGDLLDLTSVDRILYELVFKNIADQPLEIYNVADQDNVGWSSEVPVYQADVSYKAVAGLLELIYRNYRGQVKLFQPVSATIFGGSQPPQHERTALDPRSPYAVTKAAVFHLCRHYRLDKGVYVNCGIMFNHDSPRRSEGYLLGKICKSLVRMSVLKEEELTVGDLALRVDIGYARDYMEGVVNMMLQDISDDYCIGTGNAWSIKMMVDYGMKRAGVIHSYGRVKEDRSLLSGPSPTLIADCTRAYTDFKFVPTYGIAKLMGILIDHYRKEMRV